MSTVLDIQKIVKYYGNKSNLTKAIDNISFSVLQGEFVAIMGASGSGKTTLLNCISTIDRVTSGHIFVNGTDITALKGNALNKFRREELGFIFQDFNRNQTTDRDHCCPAGHQRSPAQISLSNVRRTEAAGCQRPGYYYGTENDFGR